MTNTPVHRPRTAVPQGNTSFQDRGPVTGTSRSDTCVDMWGGQVQNFDLLDRRDQEDISGKILKMKSLREKGHDMNLPRPPFKTTSWQETD